MAEEKSDPQDIKKVADQVLALSLPVGKDEIDALADRVRELVAGLPDVDDILNSTSANLELARRLLNDANRAKYVSTRSVQRIMRNDC